MNCCDVGRLSVCKGYITYLSPGIAFSENIISFLLERFNPKEKDMKVRVGTLAIIRHLITHSGIFIYFGCSPRPLENRLDDLRGLIVTGVKPLVQNEKDYKVFH